MCALDHLMCKADLPECQKQPVTMFCVQTALSGPQSHELPAAEISAFVNETRNFMDEIRQFMDEMRVSMRNIDSRVTFLEKSRP